MANKVISRHYMNLQGKGQELLGEHMQIVKDAEGKDRADAIVLLKAVETSVKAVTDGLATVDPTRPWGNLVRRNAGMIAAFLKGIENERTN